MKKLLSILLIIVAFTANATTYYVKNGGSDGAAGTSDGTAWATISKVNGETFNAGDSILFNRGDLWRERLVNYSGSSSGYVYYGAYGTGVKPKFYGSTNESETGDWNDLGSNLWSNKDATFTKDVGNIIFNGYSCGVKKQTSGAVTSQGDFWYSFTGDSILVYSVGNPATFYGDIECALRHYIGLIDASGKSYVEIANFDIRYTGGEGIALYNDCSHIKIHDCDISYIGGSDMLQDYTVRWGNGIDSWANATDMWWYDNYISNCYDAGVSPQYTHASTTKTINNIQIYNNVIDSCEYSYEFFNRPAGGLSDSVMFYNNTCIDAGYGWSHNQRWDSSQGHHLRISDNTATATNCIIKNNIFDGAITWSSSFGTTDDTDDVDLDYNIYNVGTTIAEYTDSPDTETFTTLSAWQTASSDDVNSINDAPLLNADYTLQSGSPAIDAGIDVGLPYNGAAPDMGAFEYIPYSVYYNTQRNKFFYKAK